MKKEVIILVFVMLFGLSMVSAVECQLNTTLVSQDPYPAVPGEYVKLVFQVSGVETTDCGPINIELLDNYPISFDEGAQKKFGVMSGTFARDFNSDWVVPFKVRIDENAVDGDNKVELALGSDSGLFLKTIKDYYVYVENIRADFEIHVDKYSYSTKELTLEILNIEKNDVQALTLEIPPQSGVQVRGSNRAIVGDLDSSEFTTADFKADIWDKDLEVKVIYNDENSVRRELTKVVPFEASYFQPIEGDNGKANAIYFVIIVFLIIIIWILWIFRRRNNKEKMLKRGSARL